MFIYINRTTLPLTETKQEKWQRITSLIYYIISFNSANVLFANLLEGNTFLALSVGNCFWCVCLLRIKSKRDLAPEF